MICCEMLSLIPSSQWKLTLLIGPDPLPPGLGVTAAVWPHVYHGGCHTRPSLAPIQGVDVGEVHGGVISVTVERWSPVSLLPLTRGNIFMCIKHTHPTGSE